MQTQSALTLSGSPGAPGVPVPKGLGHREGQGQPGAHCWLRRGLSADSQQEEGEQVLRNLVSSPAPLVTISMVMELRKPHCRAAPA